MTGLAAEKEYPLYGFDDEADLSRADLIMFYQKQKNAQELDRHYFIFALLDRIDYFCTVGSPGYEDGTLLKELNRIELLFQKNYRFMYYRALAETILHLEKQIVTMSCQGDPCIKKQYVFYPLFDVLATLMTKILTNKNYGYATQSSEIINSILSYADIFNAMKNPSGRQTIAASCYRTHTNKVEAAVREALQTNMFGLEDIEWVIEHNDLAAKNPGIIKLFMVARVQKIGRDDYVKEMKAQKNINKLQKHAR